ncbi:hypothetical protein QJQ45_024574 [Haematococcus lacustris]|nr:hypothetical protein QJQ45_024574 [Haematococcus lacustris]
MSFYLAEQAPAPYTVRSHGLVAPREPRATFPRGTVHHAAECGDVEAIQRYVQQGASQGYPASVVLQSREDVLGMLPLHIAAERGHLELLKYLLANQVDIDAGDKFRVTALHLASIQGHLECVRLLLQHRAAVQAVDTEGDTALHWAATKGHTEVVVLLGKYGAAVDAVNSKGWTPLHRAVYNGRRECSEQLVRQGASLTATTADGNSALHLAAFMNQLSVMETLLSLGAAPTPLNARQQSPLQLCITEAAREIILQADPTAATVLTPRPPSSSSSSSSSRPASHPPPASGQASGAAGAAGGPRAGSGPDAYLPDVSAQMQSMQLAEVLRSRASRGEQFPDSPTGGPPGQVGPPQQPSSLVLQVDPGRPALSRDLLSEADTRGPVNPYTARPAQAAMTSELERLSLGASRTPPRPPASSTPTDPAPRGTPPSAASRPPSSSPSAARTPSRGPTAQTDRGSSAVGRSPARLPPRGSGGVAAGGARGTPGKAQANGQDAEMPKAAATAAVESLTGNGGERGTAVSVAHAEDGAGGRLPGLDWQAGHRALADEWQQQVKDENRRTAVAAGSGGRLLIGASGQGTRGESAPLRPQSANKKFLQKYDLHKFNLFAP